nr:hypothetical protein [Tanacetum cinerariifolium]
VSAWNSVTDRFKSRLFEWKARTMSFKGRLTLVKYVLGANGRMISGNGFRIGLDLLGVGPLAILVVRTYLIWKSRNMRVFKDTPPLNIQTTPVTTSQAPTVTATENINQVETQKENAQVEEDEFINIFSTPIHEQGETSSRYVDSSNMHTFYQRRPSKHRWTKDHPLEQVIGNPSQSIRTRRQLEIDGKMYMFALTISLTEPKNIKEAMADSAWIKTMASVQISSDPALECQTMALEHDSLSLGRKCQENVSHGDKTGTTSNELDLLFSSMFDELLNGSSKVVFKSSAVSAADALIQRQTTPLNNHTTPVPTCQTPSIAPTVISSENINQEEPHAENDQVADDEFINIFSTPVTRRQLESDAEMCMFALTMSRTEPKNIKEAMADSAWIESMQEKLHQYDRLVLATDPEMCMYALIVSTAEPKNIKEVMADFAWIEVMQEELHQFERLHVWNSLTNHLAKRL